MKNKVYTEKEWLEIRDLLERLVQLKSEVIEGKLITDFTSEEFIEMTSKFFMDEKEALSLFEKSKKPKMRLTKGTGEDYLFTKLSKVRFVSNRLNELGQIGYKRLENKSLLPFKVKVIILLFSVFAIGIILSFIKSRS